MYLALGTRPDISFPINHLAGFLDCYRFEHWRAAIHVLQYLNGMRTLALTLGSTAPISLSGHVDAHFANELDKRKSVMGYKFSLRSGAISWASRKQKVVTLSSTEAEYIGTSEAAKEACWLRMLLSGISVPIEIPTPILCDDDAVSSPLTKCSMLVRNASTIDTTTSAIASKRRKSSYRVSHLPTPSQRPFPYRLSSDIAPASGCVEGVFTSVRGCTAAGPKGVCWFQAPAAVHGTV
jgi:hypothetical protein